MRRGRGEELIEMAMSPYKRFYLEKVVPALMERFGYKNVMQVPKLEKICINMGLGKAQQDQNILDEAVSELSLITGQRPVLTRAKKSVAAFRVRKGNIVGCRVTLRDVRMYEFLNKLINIALPRIRDFRGLSPNSFDGRGNYTLGISDQTIFPEVDYDKVKETLGMDITIVTTAETDEEARELLRLMGMPFRER